MNTNFENMIKELKNEFPDDWGKGLNGLEIEIIDDVESLDELAMEDGRNIAFYFRKKVNKIYLH